MTSSPKTLGGREQRPRFVAEAVRNLQLDKRNFAWLTADYTLTDGTAAQHALNSSSNGAFSVSANTAYEVDGCYFINVSTSTPTTTGGGHTWSILFGGTATLSTLGTALFVQSRTGSGLTAVSGLGIQTTGVATATAVTANSTTTTETAVVSMSGRVSIANAGTLVPQVQLSTTTNGTNTMKNGSYVRLHAIGHKSVKTLGIWS